MLDQPYWGQNAEPFDELCGRLAADFPHTAQAMDLDPAQLPPQDQRRDMWAIVMGKQHGGRETSDSGEKF